MSMLKINSIWQQKKIFLILLIKILTGFFVIYQKRIMWYSFMLSLETLRKIFNKWIEIKINLPHFCCSHTIGSLFFWSDYTIPSIKILLKMNLFIQYNKWIANIVWNKWIYKCMYSLLSNSWTYLNFSEI